MNTKQQWVLGGVCVAALSLFSAGARADSIRVNQGGLMLLTVKSDAFGKSAQHRADDIHDRLRYVLGDSRFASTDIRVVRLSSYRAKIVAGDQLIVQVGEADAKANGSTTMALANEWASRLRQILPRLTAMSLGPVATRSANQAPPRATNTAVR